MRGSEIYPFYQTKSGFALEMKGLLTCMKKRKFYPLLPFGSILTLCILISVLLQCYLPAKAEAGILSQGKRLEYRNFIPEADNYATHIYSCDLNGQSLMAFCIEAHHAALPGGNYDIQTLQGSQYELLMKVLACGYGSPYCVMDQIWPGIVANEPERAYLYTHIAATYAYIGATAGTTEDLWYKGISEEIAEQYNITDFIELCAGMKIDLTNSYIHFFQDPYVTGRQKVAFLGAVSIEQLGSVSIAKKGEVLTAFRDGNFIWEEKGLPGTVFELRAKETIYDGYGNIVFKPGEKVKTIKTNKKGIATAKSLYPGRYEIHETSPTPGYVMDTNVYEATISKTALYKKVTIHNIRQKIDLTIIKKDSKKQTPLHGGNFELYNSEDIFNVYGNLIVPKDTRLAVASANANGKISFHIDLPFGKYYVKETQAPVDYELNPNPLNLSFEYPDSSIEILKSSYSFYNKQLQHFAYLTLRKSEDSFYKCNTNYVTGEEE